MRRAEDLVRGTMVASVQRIYVRLTEVMDHPLSSAADVGRVIAEDPGLTARLLRLVNSPMYGFPIRIDTVSKAISIVGMVQLHDLALGTSFLKLFEQVPARLVNMDSFWRHSIACGVAARLIAVHRGEANVERYFVAGLLHDIGRPIIYVKAPAEATQALEAAGRDGTLLVQEETRVLGFHHGVVGATLLEQWRLPGMLGESVAWHHTPRMAARYPVETAVVHVADVIANALQLGTSGERLVPTFDRTAWDLLALPEGILPGLLIQLRRQYSDAVNAFLTDQ